MSADPLRTAAPDLGPGPEVLGSQYRNNSLTRRVKPDAITPRVIDLPRYVQACELERWHLALWKPLDGPAGEVLRVPYRCRSWRHAGACRRWRASQNFARLRDALATVDPRHVTYMVLTLDPKVWPSRAAAFLDLWRCWQTFRQALGRNLIGRIQYATTVEQHRSGWPHVNALLVNGELARHVGPPSADDAEWTTQEKATRAWLKPYLVRAGFGYMTTVQRARDGRAVAGYLVKLAAELDTAAAEVVKFSQVPELAPAGFRRLRASRGFLPPARVQTDWTGHLERYALPTPDERAARTLEVTQWDANPTTRW